MYWWCREIEPFVFDFGKIISKNCVSALNYQNKKSAVKSDTAQPFCCSVNVTWSHMLMLPEAHAPLTNSWRNHSTFLKRQLTFLRRHPTLSRRHAVFSRRWQQVATNADVWKKSDSYEKRRHKIVHYRHATDWQRLHNIACSCDVATT